MADPLLDLFPDAARLRLRHPKHEERHPWLGLLFDALALIDAGMERSLAQRPPHASPVACRPGCDRCCQRQLIPVTPLEIAGLTWFSVEMLAGAPRREVLRQVQQERHEGCRFLLKGRCAVYPLRPIACRRFVVFNAPCAAGEDVWITRRQDVLIPSPEHKIAADGRMLPYYGFQEAKAIETALRQDYLRSVSQLLFSCSWAPLAQAMSKHRPRPA